MGWEMGLCLGFTMDFFDGKCGDDVGISWELCFVWGGIYMDLWNFIGV